MKTLVRMAAGAAVATGVGTAALAQEGGPPKWSVGALGLFNDSPFAAEDSEINAVPYIAYRGERFYLEGLEAGFRLLPPAEGDGPSLSLDVIAAARMQPGTSRDKVTADVGLRAGLHGSFGSLTVTGLYDITDTFSGIEARADYSYTFTSDKLFITPKVGAVWQQKKTANYMWGVTQEQQDKMIADNKSVILPVYQLDDFAVNYEGSLTAVYQMTDRVSLISFVSGTYLDKDIRDNPGIDKRYNLTAGFGVAYNF